MSQSQAFLAMKWLAPAKINLSLRVLGRRADGFHEIETLMAPLSLADELDIRLDADQKAGSIELTCTEPSLPTGDGNLAYRAAVLFRTQIRGDLPGVRIHLTKRVPHGAGLGGGSSDAATVLLALNGLCSAHLTDAQLASLAAELGSDVPFFICRNAALCRGRGERVEPVTLTEQIPLLLIKPAFPIPTPWAYRRWRDSREIPGVSYTPQVFPWGELVNDLERPVFEKYLVLAEMKNWLLAQPEVAGALLSGSGSTMLAVLHQEEKELDQLSQKIRAQFGDVWLCACTTKTRKLAGTSTPTLKRETSA